MKKRYSLFTVFCALLFFTIPAMAEKGHDIKIQIKGYPKDSMARIGYYYGKSRYNAQDSARADKNGWLHFKGDKKLPEGVYICLMPKAYFEFLVTEQSFTLETDTADLELHMKIKGSKENSQFYEFRKYTTKAGRKADSFNKILKKTKNPDSIKTIKAEMKALDIEVDAFRKAFIAKYPGSFSVSLLTSLQEPEIPQTPILPDGKKDSTFPYRYFKNHYFDHLNFSDSRIIRTPFFEGKLEFFLKNMLQPYPDSICVDVDKIIDKSVADSDVFKYTLSWMLNHYEDSQIMGMDAVTSHIIEKYYLSGMAKWITPAQLYHMDKRDSIVKNLLIGKPAPELYLTDSLGKLITLYSVHHKYIVLYFWDATCGHCQKATPLLHQFYEKNKDSIDLMVYAATIERKTKDWTKYIRENKLGDWINVWDSLVVTDFAKKYDIYSTPVIYILDANKKIIAKRLDVSQLQDYFDHLEKESKDKKP